ncbi:MAG TPA: alpha/beta hydrolase fold domain-containing protein [Xanthobacteraceae bacterium]|nr:alpha/beta hydrolase fold domain-containing protein [Xanthobacteraceae bacterium]
MWFRTRLSRRAFFPAAAVGTLALTSGEALAQRCPANPPHTKGPLVWLDLDQQELDDAYDQSVYAFNQSNIAARRKANSELAISVLGSPQRVAYGPTEIQKLDIYRSKRANAPIAIYVHGGAWRNGVALENAYLAEPFVKAGVHVVMPDFINVVDAGGDLFPMVEQVRRAVGWVYRNADSFGGDRNAMYLMGHSSGGHLGGCIVITDWAKEGLPLDILKGALLGSGMYDLKPVRLSKRGTYVKFTDAMEEELSAQRHLDRLHTPLILTHGTLETPEFQRQTRDFYAAVKAAGKPVELRVGVGYNHFETQETLGNPYGLMGRAAFEMMKL